MLLLCAGNFCIRDLSPEGSQYRDRFLCRGQQILNFRVFRYSQPDPELSREFDLNVDLKMASITYVHTQRFYSTIMDFFNQFQRLQATLNATRLQSSGRLSGAAAHKTGGSRTSRGVGFRPPAFGTTRGSRVKLTVSVRAPLLVLPMSSSSSRVLMIDLAALDISNRFSFAGDEGTISATKLGHLRSGELGGRRSRAQGGSRSSHRSRSSRRSNRSAGKITVVTLWTHVM